MGRKKEFNCEFCNVFVVGDYRSKFCSKSCGNKARVLSQETKAKIAKTLSNKPKVKKIFSYDENSVRAGKYTKGKFRKRIKSIYEVSSRTRLKLYKRVGLLDFGCFNCGWAKAICDIHHINGRKIEDPHNHKNLTYLCPNCHRLVEKNLVECNFKTLDEFLAPNWADLYYG